MNPAKWVFNILLFLLILVDRRSYVAAENTTVAAPAIPIIKDGQLLLSDNKTFALGFFSPGNSTTRRYVGIWYNNIPDLTVVWVANRDKPLNDDSGTLAIDRHGNILIYTIAQNFSLWSTNVSVPSTNDVSVQLLDTGNLVVIQRESQNQKIVWESFDYPSHTLLPYMKIGYDRRTGFSRFLTSWKAPDDPGSGNFSYRINPGGYPQLVLYQGDVPRWRAGPWTGIRWHAILEFMTSYIFNATYVDNSVEIYYMNGVTVDSVLTRMTLDESGFLHRSTWWAQGRSWEKFAMAPMNLCDDYNRCGPNSICDLSSGKFECGCLPGFEPKGSWDWFLIESTRTNGARSDGCIKKRENATCRSGEGFVTVARVKVPDTTKARADKSMSLEACEKACLEDCNCTAYTSANDTTGIGCVTWYGDMIDTQKQLATERISLYELTRLN